MKSSYLLFICLVVFGCVSCKKSFVTSQPQGGLMYQISDFGPPLVLNWTKIPDFPRQTTRAYGFAINLKGYVGGGWGPAPSPGNTVKDLWEFDPALQTWTKKADLPGLATERAASFVIGNKGYISTGYHRYSGPEEPNFLLKYLHDTWEYDPAVDQWTKKADFPGGARDGAVGMSINGKGYVGLGKGITYFHGIPVTTIFKDWWEFDPIANTWTKKKSFPGTGRNDAVGAAAGSFGYVGTGLGSSDWWQYNPATDTWTQKNTFPGVPRGDAVAFSSTNLGVSTVYVATGRSEFSSWMKDLWAYNPSTNQWTLSYNMPVGRYYAVSFVVNNIAYVGSGSDPISPITSKFWRLQL